MPRRTLPRNSDCRQNHRLQLCRPLSGAVSSLTDSGLSQSTTSFNCAAPFRERLACISPRVCLTPSPLQLCRPLSGAVSPSVGASRITRMPLQLCRPLSGAVRSSLPRHWPTGHSLQLCRPLSGAVSGALRRSGVTPYMLQLCRPLSGAVSGRYVAGNDIQPNGFNCAAPFRERLADVGADADVGFRAASIVPPPFGSG